MPIYEEVEWGTEHLTDDEFDAFVYLSYIVEIADDNLNRLEKSKKNILKSDWNEMKSYMRAIRFSLKNIKT